MIVWIITVGEPSPIDGKNVRLLRSAILAEYLIKRNHQVLFWTSSFNHTTKTHRVEIDTCVQLNEKYQLYLLKGPGYRKNISTQRLIDHRVLATRFAKLAPTMPRPDIILSSLPTIEMCDEATRLGKLWEVPVVLDARDMWPDIFVNQFPGFLRRIAQHTLFSRIFRQTYRACQNATAIIGITPGFVKWALGYANRSATEFDRDFPFGYKETNIGEMDLAAAHHYWEEKGIEKKSNSFNICLFAHIGRMIDMPAIIGAAKMILEKELPHRFIICGEGEMLQEYKNLAKDCSNILFPGWVDGPKIRALMQLSHIGLLPYRNEPDFLISIPNKPVEYMSGKLPVLSSLHGTVGELLKNENCGLLYNEGDSESLFRKLEYLFNNLNILNTMSDSAYRVYKERFAADKVYNEMADYLEKLSNSNLT